MSSFRDLLAYKKAFALALEIFETSKTFPKSERYLLIDQINRSSRGVCSNIAEGYRKRRYPKHFIAKCTDADGENSETQVWLDFALNFKYISEAHHQKLNAQSEEVGKLIGYMIQNPEKYR